MHGGEPQRGIAAEVNAPRAASTRRGEHALALEIVDAVDEQHVDRRLLREPIQRHARLLRHFDQAAVSPDCLLDALHVEATGDDEHPRRPKLCT